MGNPNEYVKLCYSCNRRHDLRRMCDSEAYAEAISDRAAVERLISEAEQFLKRVG